MPGCSFGVGLFPNIYDVGAITNIQGWPRASTTSTRTTKRASWRTYWSNRPQTPTAIRRAGSTDSTWAPLTLLRYDNSHEDTKGHEFHTAAGNADVEFPGTEAVLAEFWASAEEYWDAVGGDPPRPY